jgi:hypothetical protein
MPEPIDTELQPSPPPNTGDRRRPKRVDFDNPFLISLLRRKPPAAKEGVPTPQGLAESSEIPAELDCDRPLSTARGIGIAIAIGFLSWLLIGVGLWYYFAR